MDVIENLSALASRIILRQQDPSKGLLPRLKRSGSYLTLNKLLSYAVPFAGRAGFEVIEVKPGSIKARIPLKGNSDHIGRLYSGALFTLAELPGEVIALFEFGAGYIPVLQTMKITYQRPAKTDVTVEFKIPKKQIKQIITETSKQGASDFVLYGRLFDSQQQLVAETEGVYRLYNKEVYAE